MLSWFLTAAAAAAVVVVDQQQVAQEQCSGHGWQLDVATPGGPTSNLGQVCLWAVGNCRYLCKHYTHWQAHCNNVT